MIFLCWFISNDEDLWWDLEKSSDFSQEHIKFTIKTVGTLTFKKLLTLHQGINLHLLHFKTEQNKMLHEHSVMGKCYPQTLLVAVETGKSFSGEPFGKTFQ